MEPRVDKRSLSVLDGTHVLIIFTRFSFVYLDGKMSDLIWISVPAVILVIACCSPLCMVLCILKRSQVSRAHSKLLVMCFMVIAIDK